MDRFEEALKQALHRREAPEGFAQRVLARAADPPVAASFWDTCRGWFRLPALRWSAAVAMTLVLMFGVQYAAEQRRRAQGELARQQVLTAMRITAGKLDRARSMVLQATSRIGADRERSKGAGPARPANMI
jgi:hypothetical protein